jgi:hypothetical protein
VYTQARSPQYSLATIDNRPVRAIHKWPQHSPYYMLCITLYHDMTSVRELIFFQRFNGGREGPPELHSKRPQPEGHAQVLQVSQSRDYKTRDIRLRLRLKELKEQTTPRLRHYNQTTYLPTPSRPKWHPHPLRLRTLWCRPQPNRGRNPWRNKEPHTREGTKSGENTLATTSLNTPISQ